MKSFESEKVFVIDSRRELDGQRGQAGDRSWIRLRTYQKNNVLLNSTVAWMANLPEAVRPMALVRRFPRIANSIADLWRRVGRCEEYLESLVVDRRGNRTGFPPEVAQELIKLRSFYSELHPENRSTSDMAEQRN